ncbi:MAG: hypothetical protein HQ583_06435, partial [Candidatus Abyssubacteria bacterium]|nr:hypothetical protein [Candidatus Abyssubacteria bacterium]
MKCNKAQSLMLDHLYGDLKPRKQKALLQHLQVCRTCSEEFEAHKATSSAFARLDMEEPSPELSARIAAMAARDLERQELLRPLTSGWNWKPALATVAAATVAVVIIVRYVPYQTIRQTSFDAPASRSVQAT